MGSHGNCGRPWTPYEDDLLRAAVGIYGDNTEKWKTIALSVPGRTNKACRKRWLHSLSPSVKKSAWTAEEDQLLLSLFAKHPGKWSQIAREIPGRTDDACSKRYREALDPNLKKDEWTDEEDVLLLDALARHGGPTNPKWGLIGQDLRRSGLGCRNRWRLIERKRNNAAARQNASSQAQPNNENLLPQLPRDVWSLFAGDSSQYWTAAINSVCVGLHDVQRSQPGREVAVTDIGEEHSGELPLHSATAQSESIGTHAGIVQNMGINATAGGAALSNILPESPCLCPSSSDRVGSESQPINRSVEKAALSVSCPNDDDLPSFPPGTPVPDAVDYGPPQDDDSFRLYDDYTRESSSNDNTIERWGVSEEALYAPEVHNSVQITGRDSVNETENLGTLADAASTLSPSPCAAPASRPVQQVINDLVAPPRKRRRTATNCPAIGGIHVIFGLVGKKAAPKLSSSLPVAGDSSILAYSCGHSVCLSSGRATSSACFSTAAELLNHFKDKHLSGAGDSDETPFRCGLKGCNKRWKSINGLQYHLQVSKVHYQHVYSRAAATKKQSTNRVPATDSTGTAESSCSAARRLHRCPHPGCVKEYKQLSGLRYHLLHGHPKDMPVQLDAVPPRIAKMLGVGSVTGTLDLSGVVS